MDGFGRRPIPRRRQPREHVFGGCASSSRIRCQLEDGGGGVGGPRVGGAGEGEEGEMGHFGGREEEGVNAEWEEWGKQEAEWAGRSGAMIVAQMRESENDGTPAQRSLSP